MTKVEFKTVEKIVVRLHDMKENAINVKNGLLDKFKQTSNINTLGASMDVEREIATYDAVLDEIQKILDGAK